MRTGSRLSSVNLCLCVLCPSVVKFSRFSLFPSEVKVLCFLYLFAAILTNHFHMSVLTPHALCWRRIIDNNSLEYAVAQPLAAGLELAGTIVAIHNQAPLEVRYRIECDADWRTRALSIEQRLGLQESSLFLAADTSGSWNDQRRGPIDSLAGCVDVDLELTPITNSLPVNRLNLAVGQVEEIAVAWVRFPSLEIVRARQSYERLSDRTYRYRSLSSGFTADIDVDEIGLTVRYEGIWERVTR
jgi:uncharacterized protein